MIEEAYVSFEIAKLLKEKGFDISCYGRYSVRSQELHLDTTRPCNNGGISQYSAPTHQMVMAWLREIHNIDISVSPEIGMSGTKIYVPIISTYSTFTDKESKLSQRKIKLHYDFDIYEEAIEAALKYSLENLI